MRDLIEVTSEGDMLARARRLADDAYRAAWGELAKGRLQVARWTGVPLRDVRMTLLAGDEPEEVSGE